jgi:hypothetical protein
MFHDQPLRILQASLDFTSIDSFALLPRIIIDKADELIPPPTSIQDNSRHLLSQIASASDHHLYSPSGSALTGNAVGDTQNRAMHEQQHKIGAREIDKLETGELSE